MPETVWIALIAVLGTSLGAAISPTITALKDVATARAGSRSERIRAAADFANKLNALGLIGPKDYESWDVASTKGQAIDARFELAKHLVRGEGNVDRFAEHSIETISRFADSRRRTAAQHAAAAILDWARGDKAPQALHLFEVDRYGDEDLII